MIKLCICIICATIIFLTWRLEFLIRKVRRLENELYVTQVQLSNLEEDVFDLKYEGEDNEGISCL